MSGWKWWRTLEWHESLLWVGTIAFAQDAPHLFSPLVQGVTIGLLSAVLLVAMGRRFGLLVLMAIGSLWQAAVMQPAAPVPYWRLTVVVFSAMFAVMLAVGAWYRWRNGREEPVAHRA